MKHLKILLTLILTSLLFSSHAMAADDDPKIIVAKVHADWCGSCKAIDPAFRRLKKKLNDEPVLFVTMDMTNKYTTKASTGLAEFLQILDILKKNQKTGKLLVIDAESQTLLKSFNKKDSLETIQNYLTMQLR